MYVRIEKYNLIIVDALETRDEQIPWHALQEPPWSLPHTFSASSFSISVSSSVTTYKTAFWSFPYLLTHNNFYLYSVAGFLRQGPCQWLCGWRDERKERGDQGGKKEGRWKERITLHSSTSIVVVELLSCGRLLCSSMDCSPSGSSVHGIFEARILEWVAISFCRGCSQSRDQSHVFWIGRWILYRWATSEAPKSII